MVEKRALALVAILLVATAAVAETAAARETRSGQKSCRSYQHVVIVSRAAGTVTHSFSVGPPHLGYTVHRHRFGAPYYYTARATYTWRSSVYWSVLAADRGSLRGDIQEAYAVCLRR